MLSRQLHLEGWHFRLFKLYPYKTDTQVSNLCPFALEAKMLQYTTSVPNHEDSSGQQAGFEPASSCLSGTAL